jgi:rhomboid protease GluP
MDELIMSKKDEMIMKLLHYFITEEGYNPIVLHGAKDEIWLEKLNGDYKIVRISSNYIHNDEQLDFDIYKTRQIMKNIKKKTFTININALNIFLNLGDNVHITKLENEDYGNIKCVNIKEIDDLSRYDYITKHFPTITRKTNFKEKGAELFMKLTGDINKKNEEDTHKTEDIFKIKKPIISYGLIAVNTLIFLAMYILGNGSYDVGTLLNFGASHPDLIRSGEYYRLITSAFLHIGFMHFLFNNYAIYIIGPQLESFFGKTKFIIIYLFSAISGNLLSMLFTNSIGAGASGAIFGLLGALLYFGHHYRVYLGSVIKSQIVPLIIINLLIGFSIPGIDNAAHIGGLIGGLLITIALGVKYKSTKFEEINGWIITAIFTGFLIYMAFFGAIA